MSAAFFDFEQRVFPFAVVAFNEAGEIRYAQMVTDVCVLEVPPLGDVSRAVMIDATGVVTDYQPKKEES